MEKSSCRVSMIFGVAAAILVAQGGKAQTVSETVTYFHTDRLGSTVMTSDASGNIQSTVDYRPYGQPVQNDPGSVPGYTGQYNDPATGLTYMRARYYDSNVGVFLSIDPEGSNAGDIGSFGRFVYANDNPLRFVDPTGMKTTTLCYNCSLGPSTTNLPGITAVGVSYPDGAGFVSLWTNYNVWIRYGIERGDGGKDPRQNKVCKAGKYKNVRTFVAANQTAAELVGSDLQTLSANILGLAGLESAWGTGPLVAGGINNYFSLTAGPAFSYGAIGTYKLGSNKFERYPGSDLMASGAAFAHSYFGKRVIGTYDAASFVKALNGDSKYNSENLTPAYNTRLHNAISLADGAQKCQ